MARLSEEDTIKVFKLMLNLEKEFDTSPRLYIKKGAFQTDIDEVNYQAMIKITFVKKDKSDFKAKDKKNCNTIFKDIMPV